jgi:hypothetical protein
VTRELLAGADIARLAGVSRQRAFTLAKTAGFPRPALETSLGPFWRTADVEKFLATWERRPGRPTKPLEELSERRRKLRLRNASRGQA